MSDIATVIEHFKKYSLVSVKRNYYLLWVEAYNDRSNKALVHQNRSYFPKAVGNKYFDLKDFSYPNLHPAWVVGFTNADGGFRLSPTNNTFNPSFGIVQHKRDLI